MHRPSAENLSELKSIKEHGFTLDGASVRSGKFCVERNKMLVECRMCRQTFQAAPWRVGRAKNIFCSRKCRYKFQVGRNGKDAPGWKGGRYQDATGYIFVLIHGTYKREHILVMEKFMGRSLLDNEIIHHINGIKSDNRIENLLLLNSHSEHAQTHYKNKIKLLGYNPSTHKFCNKCQSIKTLAEFYKKSLKIISICKECRKKIQNTIRRKRGGGSHA